MIKHNPHSYRNPTLGPSEVPREELEFDDLDRLWGISHHARAGLTSTECQEPLGASCFAGRRPAGMRAIVEGGIVGTRCGSHSARAGPR